MPEFKIGGRLVGDGHPPLVIAECGINDGGDRDRAEQLVRAAAHAGCEAVKWQVHVRQECADKKPWHDWDTLKTAQCVAARTGLLCGYTAFCGKSVTGHSIGAPSFRKIGSGEVSNHELIEAVAKAAATESVPVLLSTGMHDLVNVDAAVNILRAYDVPIAVLECTSSYPARAHEVRIGVLKQLRERYPDAVIGISDHNPEIYTALGAAALGASIIEKHFTVSRQWGGPDQPFSIEPDEMRRLVQGAAQIHEALTANVHGVTDDERATAKWAQHSIVAARDIKEGEKLAGAITCRRPQGPVHARRWREVQRYKAARDIRAGAQLEEADMDDWKGEDDA